MVACRSFEVLLRIDSEFAASFADYFRVGREALTPFVALWLVTARGNGHLGGLALLARWRAANVWRRWSDWSSVSIRRRSQLPHYSSAPRRGAP